VLLQAERFLRRQPLHEQGESDVMLALDLHHSTLGLTGARALLPHGNASPGLDAEASQLPVHGIEERARRNAVGLIREFDLDEAGVERWGRAKWQHARHSKLDPFSFDLKLSSRQHNDPWKVVGGCSDSQGRPGTQTDPAISVDPV